MDTALSPAVVSASAVQATDVISAAIVRRTFELWTPRKKTMVQSRSRKRLRAANRSRYEAEERARRIAAQRDIYKPLSIDIDLTRPEIDRALAWALMVIGTVLIAWSVWS